MPDFSARTWTEGAVILPDGGPRVIRLSGPDAEDFLQRLTTNDVRLLTRQNAWVTALLSPIGRIRSVFTALRARDAFLLIAPRRGAARLRAVLQSQIFFMDAVEVADASADWRYLQLAGAAADQLLTPLGFKADAMQDGDRQTVGDWTCLYQERLEWPAYGLLVPTAQQDGLVRRLQQAHGVACPDWRAYHMQRIRAGRGGYETEFTEAYNPLEVGLAWLCADNKGCYPGQEVIARQINYGKITRELVRLDAAEPLAVDETVRADAASIGVVTSAERDVATGMHHALAVVRTGRLAPETDVTVGGRRAGWTSASPSG